MKQTAWLLGTLLLCCFVACIVAVDFSFVAGARARHPHFFSFRGSIIKFVASDTLHDVGPLDQSVERHGQAGPPGSDAGIGTGAVGRAVRGATGGRGGEPVIERVARMIRHATRESSGLVSTSRRSRPRNEKSPGGPMVGRHPDASPLGLMRIAPVAELPFPALRISDEWLYRP